MGEASQPLVTIAIPTYNRPGLLKRALASVAALNYSNLEILVSDDCSPEGETKNVVMEAQKRDQRIRYFRQKRNLKYEANFDFLLTEAVGEYIMWLSDDDMLQPDAIQKMVGAMEDNPRAIVCGCDVQFIDENDQPLCLEKLVSLRSESAWNEKRKLFFEYPTTNIYLIIVGLYRIKMMRQLEVKQEPSCNGYYTNLEVPYLARLSLVGEIIAVPQTLFLYRSYEDSTYIKEMASISRFGYFRLRLCVRLKLFAIAIHAHISVWERISLLTVIVASGIKGEVRNMISTLVPSVMKKRIKVFLDK